MFTITDTMHLLSYMIKPTVYLRLLFIINHKNVFLGVFTI